MGDGVFGWIPLYNVLPIENLGVQIIVFRGGGLGVCYRAVRF